LNFKVFIVLYHTITDGFRETLFIWKIS